MDFAWIFLLSQGWMKVQTLGRRQTLQFNLTRHLCFRLLYQPCVWRVLFKLFPPPAKHRRKKKKKISILLHNPQSSVFFFFTFVFNISGGGFEQLCVCAPGHPDCQTHLFGLTWHCHSSLTEKRRMLPELSGGSTRWSVMPLIWNFEPRRAKWGGHAARHRRAVQNWADFSGKYKQPETDSGWCVTWWIGLRSGAYLQLKHGGKKKKSSEIETIWALSGGWNLKKPYDGYGGNRVECIKDHGSFTFTFFSISKSIKKKHTSLTPLRQF